MKKIEIDLDVNRALESARQRSDESPNQILRRLIGIDGLAPADDPEPRQRRTRSSGAYSTFLGRHVIEANNLKQLLARSILVAEKMQPGFIEQLSMQPTRKGRYIVAHTASGLYPRSPHLVAFAEKLDETWWYDTNVGRAQVSAYLARFARTLRLPTLPAILKRQEKTTLSLADLG
jgi:hypothetical protein